MSWFKSYDEEYAELLSHLTKNWEMKPLYARAFLGAYKIRVLGKCSPRAKHVRHNCARILIRR